MLNVTEGNVNFCVVRSPQERIMSIFRYAMQGRTYLSGRTQACDASVLNDWIRSALYHHRSMPYVQGCHLVPQIDFVRNPRDGSITCDHILRHSNLEVEFNVLMEAYGLPMRWQASERKINQATVCSGVGVDDLSDIAKEALHSIYRGDYWLQDILQSIADTNKELGTAKEIIMRSHIVKRMLRSQP
eukprot:TRINITY_DN25360_c0_g2_i2.p1 TRINITY_DN25360_c0_g2~~TRINITY_DN25360_c0_g2_i2.p1  ORF type:complete len:187 (-),score=27.19 TRINITY_DN25360_c0_g2_i2:52-612(-)